MSAPAAILATFADWRTVKGRKQLQLVFEVDLERQEEVLTALGAPMPTNPKWVGIALLTKEAAEKAQGASAPVNTQSSSVNTREKRNWHQLSYAEQAGIRCTEPSFWAFIREHMGFECHDAETAANFVREHCEIESRSQIRTGTAAAHHWDNLERQYQAWRLVA